MNLARARGAFVRRVAIPMLAPWHRHRLRVLQSDTLAAVEHLAVSSGGRPMVLIGLHQHLGDIVMASAVVRHLRAAYPDAVLVFATQRRYRSLMAHNPNVDHLLDCDCIGSLVALARHPAFSRRHLLTLHGNRCELCGGTYHDDNAAFAARGIDVHGWFRHRRHLVELMFERLGCGDVDPTPELYIPEAVRSKAREQLRAWTKASARPFVALHTRTPHWPAKQWPKDRFDALVSRLGRELGRGVVVIGAEPVGEMPSPAVDLTCRTSVLETAAIIGESELFIGLDSGPSHLAAAVGTPSILLFGPTDPATCRPLGADVEIIWHGCSDDGLFAVALRPGTTTNRDIARITVDEVVEAAARRLARGSRSADAAPPA